MQTENEFLLSPLYLPEKTVALSLDLECDYGGEGIDALGRFEDLVAWLAEAGIDLTVFVEARVLQEHPGIVDLLKAPHIYPALHCFDHRKPNDDSEDIERGRDLFGEKLGRHPEGYRANTFQHSSELVKNLVELDFDWDSSYLPSWLGFGARRDPQISEVLKDGANAIRYQDLDTKATLHELPVGTLRGIGVPFIHSYQLLVGGNIAAIVHHIFGIQKLYIHDAHMVDLYKATDSLSEGVIPLLASWLYRFSWWYKGDNSLGILRAFIDRCESQGWELSSIQNINSSLGSHEF